MTYERLEKIMVEKNTKLCFSADIEDPVKVLSILGQIGSLIAVCKIHFDIFVFTRDTISREDFISGIKYLSTGLNFMIMEDRKFFDISYIVEKQFSFFKGWVDLVTVHGFVSDAVIKSIDAGVLLVSEMSNNTYDISDRCMELYRNNNNVVGFIAQKKIDNIMSFTPGISFDDKKVGDQKYRNISDISSDQMPDIIIVGRAIYEADNIVDAVKEMNVRINCDK
tara:strand:+ start:1808 stop:2476 length:669 start_codon:yes stop_codon:yes gene_type:complete